MSGSKETAYTMDTSDKLSINELHHCLGHVSHERAKLLVSKGLVEGVTLETGSEVDVCESCEWAKGERKSLLRIHDGEQHTSIDKEIHSDLWGPVPMELINHKCYYVSFTDDYS